MILQKRRLVLVVAVVFEERNGEQVDWYLDNRRGFLRDDVETDSVCYNPIFLNIDQSVWTSDGSYQ